MQATTKKGTFWRIGLGPWRQSRAALGDVCHSLLSASLSHQPIQWHTPNWGESDCTGYSNSCPLAFRCVFVSFWTVLPGLSVPLVYPVTYPFFSSFFQLSLTPQTELWKLLSTLFVDSVAVTGTEKKKRELCKRGHNCQRTYSTVSTLVWFADCPRSKFSFFKKCKQFDVILYCTLCKNVILIITKLSLELRTAHTWGHVISEHWKLTEFSFWISLILLSGRQGASGSKKKQFLCSSLLLFSWGIFALGN